MGREIGGWERLSGVILSALFVLLVYRAATQSLVHDEALTYQMYVAGPLSAIFTVYDANHHFLSTVLMRASATLFGPSEFVLRLPSLAAAGWYFITILRLAARALGEGYLIFLATVLAAANPLVLDFLVAARGYSIALAFLTYGVYCIVIYLSQSGSRPGNGSRMLLVRTSIALGLSITANLTAAIPAFVIATVLLVTLGARRSPDWKYFILPLGAIVLLFFLFTPVHRASGANFYYGAPSLTASLNDLAAVSLGHNDGLGGWNRETSWKPWWRGFVVLVTLAMVVRGIVIGGPVWLNRRRVTPCDGLLLIASVTIAGSWCILIVAHHTIGLLYPLDRTGLYFLPLAGLAITGIAAGLRDRPRAIAISRVCAAFAGLIALEYALQLNRTHFYIWRYDADTKAIVGFLAGRNHAASVRVGASWPLDPALNYYRERRGLTWLEPLARQGPDGEYDYYILCEPEQDRIARYQLHVIYRGAVSGTVVAER